MLEWVMSMGVVVCADLNPHNLTPTCLKDCFEGMYPARATSTLPEYLLIETCDFDSCAGCTDTSACTYDPDATLSNPQDCDYPIDFTKRLLQL